MQITDNLWQEAWSSCKPVPARRQRRLFDETREAERLFHQLASLRPADMVQMVGTESERPLIEGSSDRHLQHLPGG